MLCVCILYFHRTRLWSESDNEDSIEPTTIALQFTVLPCHSVLWIINNEKYRYPHSIYKGYRCLILFEQRIDNNSIIQTSNEHTNAFNVTYKNTTYKFDVCMAHFVREYQSRLHWTSKLKNIQSQIHCIYINVFH